MSQAPRRTRVRQLAGSVWPGRDVDGYANLIAARLCKLAASASTGVLPVSGRGNGAIFFRAGQVVGAESSRTPTRRAAGLPAPGFMPHAAAPLAPGRPAGGAGLVPGSSLSRLGRPLALIESTIDAVTDLLSSESRYAKFHQPADPPPALVHPIGVPDLLREVDRRQRVLRQLAPVISADTPVARRARVAWPRLQVLPRQWALVVRVGDGATPRGLALELGGSVFATTIEVYRLVVLGLLAVPGQPAAAGEPAAVMSFMRALPERAEH